MFLRIPTGEANPNYLQPTKCSDPPKYEDISGRLSHHNIKSIHIIHGYFYFCYEMILKSTNMDTLRQFNLVNFPATLDYLVLPLLPCCKVWDPGISAMVCGAKRASLERNLMESHWKKYVVTLW